MANIFNEKLKCYLNELRIFENDQIEIYIPKHNSTDMRGAINISKGIMPDVCRITVYAGGKLDIEYRLCNDNRQWSSYNYREIRSNENNWLQK